MSLKANFELSIHIESFKNIHLYDMGIYFLKISVFHYSANSKSIFARPYSFITGGDDDKTNPQNSQNKNWCPAQIDEQTDSFNTQGFLMRYYDEEHVMNDICFFKTEIDLDTLIYKDTEFSVVVDLMCASLSSFGHARKEGEVDDALFVKKATFIGQMQNAHTGLHEYMHISFDDDYFCYAKSSVHTLMQDIRFVVSENDKFVIKYHEQSKSTEPFSYSSPNSQGPKNFNDYMILKYGKNEKAYNGFYDYFIDGLRQSYFNHFSFVQFCFDNMKDTSSEVKKLKDEQIPEIPEQNYLKIFQAKNKEQKDGIQVTEVFNINDAKEFGEMTETLQLDIYQMSGTLYIIWKLINEAMRLNSMLITSQLKEIFDKRVKERWGEFIIHEPYPCDFLNLVDHLNIGKQHDNIANEIRKQKQAVLPPLNIHDYSKLPKIGVHPFLFHETYTLKVAPKNFEQQFIQGQHVVVLCHGYQGSSYDMYLLQNNISLLFPETLFLCSQTNEDDTDCEIELMGKRLAKEVAQYVSAHCPKDLAQLSFIGHSLGGLIIRAALPLLKEYQQKMFTYMSTGTPHLGTGFGSNALMSVGIKVFNFFQKSSTLDYLQMSDAGKKQDSYLYKLSQAEGFEWFEHLVFVSSYQDSYSPYDSSRIQVPISVVSNEIYKTMSHNLLGKLPQGKLTRFDVNFVLKEKSLDNMIGRTAHIMFLENEVWIKMLLHCRAELFS